MTNLFMFIPQWVWIVWVVGFWLSLLGLGRGCSGKLGFMDILEAIGISVLWPILLVLTLGYNTKRRR